MKLYTYEKETVSYKKVKLKFKFIILTIFFQICISIGFLFFISSFYNTPKEKKLKEDITYLINEFDAVNQRIIKSEVLLSQITKNDSIIYESILGVDDRNIRYFDVEYDVSSKNDYTEIVKTTNQRLSELDQELEKQYYQFNSLLKTAVTHQDMLLHIPAIQPIDNHELIRIASGWGYRTHPIYSIIKFHFGLDFSAPIGTPIYATADGTIEFIFSFTEIASHGYGNLIIIDHGYGYQTLYGHMNKFNVKIGQNVKRGEIIGYVGNTGLSTGPHLHYEVIRNGSKVNPINYLFNELTPSEYQKLIEISNSIKKSYD